MRSSAITCEGVTGIPEAVLSISFIPLDAAYTPAESIVDPLLRDGCH
jgi:hypothetical protein